MAVVYFKGLADDRLVQRAVIDPLLVSAGDIFGRRVPKKGLLERIRSRLVRAQELFELETMDELIDRLLEGNTAILADGVRAALGAELFGWPKRGVEESPTEQTIQGPRESFVETVRDNVALVRRRLKTPLLVVEQMMVGRRSATDVRLLYLRGIAPPNVVAELRRRVESIDLDVVLDSGTIEEFIRDHPFSPFPTMRSTERPDSLVADLAEGRVALLVDGSPFALVAPGTFFMFFSTPEDHYFVFYIPLVLKVIRFAAFGLSVLLTPLYVAMTTFHQELIPLPLLLNVAATQAGVPFPVALTAFGVEVVLEVLREAGLRLPRQFGQAVTIVGAIVLGQAAIQAGFVPPGLVIVTTTAAVASFAIPRTEAALSFRMLRFPFLLLASTLGFYGLAFGVALLVFHVASLKSFGVPFMSLYTPGRVGELGEEFLAIPIRLRRRVRPLAYRDVVRQGAPPKLRDPDTTRGEGGGLDAGKD